MERADCTLDDIYELLSESRRRYILYYFLDNEHANVEGLSLQIAAWELDSTVDVVTEERKQRVTTSLIHSHLPKLADYGLIEYDGRTGDVVATDELDDVCDTIARARRAEDDVTITGSSTESVLYSEPLTSSSRPSQ
ncbi:DUF7344 domain-containing protein [Natronolimnohabitans innermongolicus]|uniref:DUF7344 domain-containing protein n=1 Tax=Natronolimnohabitans innermongolicus JCM 12255 TaxID=1227499 RepID=L9WI53_9EURY|nr:hypothetical protein [Natronolimnohabitans innermongolicus]ELY49190.1 hypothetical protein C493_20867 [Natronolimnohabitans innermongolicus JCM 12255]